MTGAGNEALTPGREAELIHRGWPLPAAIVGALLQVPQQALLLARELGRGDLGTRPLAAPRVHRPRLPEAPGGAATAAPLLCPDGLRQAHVARPAGVALLGPLRRRSPDGPPRDGRRGPDGGRRR